MTFGWRVSGAWILAWSVLGPGFVSPVWAWSEHHRVTSASLADMRLETSIVVEELADFLSKESEAVAKVFHEFAEEMRLQKAQRFTAVDFLVSQPTVKGFISAARLSPQTVFRFSPPGARTISPKPDEQVKAADVLAVFSDEPDWQMDQELWGIPNYGYGDQPPYGALTGMSSRAPFHMMFRHEPWLLRMAAPELKESLAPQRVNLFSRLAHLAFNTGHRYWGYRFTAWVLHYVQDVSQPYHARALPSGSTFYLLKFAVSSQKAKMKAESSQLVENRHLIFEDTVVEMMGRKELPGAEELAQSLRAVGPGTADFDGNFAVPSGIVEILERVARSASAAAPRVDEEVVKIFGEKLTNDPTYDMDSDPSFKIAEVAGALGKRERESLVLLASERLRITGAASRAVVKALVTPVR